MDPHNSLGLLQDIFQTNRKWLLYIYSISINKVVGYLIYIYNKIVLTTNELNIYFFLVSDQTTNPFIINIIAHTSSELSIALALSDSICTTLLVRETRYLHIIQRHWGIQYNNSSKSPSCFLYKPSRALITTLAIFLASSVSPTVGCNCYRRHSEYIPEEILGYKDSRLFTLVCNPRGELITLYPRYF